MSISSDQQQRLSRARDQIEEALNRPDLIVELNLNTHNIIVRNNSRGFLITKEEILDNLYLSRARELVADL